MNDSSYIELMKKLGFTEYEAKCYLALFEKDSLTVIEIARLAGVPRPNAYQTMEKLLAKGLCVSLPGNTKKFAASDPQVVREKLFESLTDSMKTVDSMVDRLDVLYKKNRNNNNPLDYIEILKNPEQIHRKFIQLLNGAKKEILGFAKPPLAFATEELRIEQEKAQDEALKRGVIINGIVEITTESAAGKVYPEDSPLVDDSENSGTRYIEELPMKLFIFDENVSMFTLEDPIQTKLSLTMFVVVHPVLANSFKIFFESFWEKAVPIEYYLAANEDINKARAMMKRSQMFGK